MDGIKMVDLHGQYLKIKDELDAAIQGVIDSTAFIRGGDVRQFQDELSSYMGVAHTVACGNGTDALQVAMMALELQPGDEVITTPFTFIATVEVIKLLGLTPVFVDVLPATFNLDPELLELLKEISQHDKRMYFVNHFNHSRELTSEAGMAIEKLLNGRVAPTDYQ